MDEQDLDLDLALALKRLADTTVVPAADPAREAALMAAFDAMRARPDRVTRSRGRQYWGMAGLATAAAMLIAVGLGPASTGRRGSSSSGGDGATHRPLAPSARGVQSIPKPPGEFVMLPGTAGLPPLESGSLVRMDVPIAMLASMGVIPPAGRATAIRADVIVGQDGIARAVRLVD